MEHMQHIGGHAPLHEQGLMQAVYCRFVYRTVATVTPVVLVNTWIL